MSKRGESAIMSWSRAQENKIFAAAVRNGSEEAVSKWEPR